MNIVVPPKQEPRLLTTKELARVMSVRSQSIHKRYCLTGSYHGVRPLKMVNRRLMWPSDSFEQLIKGMK